MDSKFRETNILRMHDISADIKRLKVKRVIDGRKLIQIWD